MVLMFPPPPFQVSQIRITNDIVAWQNRPLEPVYLIVWMDGIVFKVQRELQGYQQNHLYCRRIAFEMAKRKCWGCGLGKNESAAFWMSVLTDIKARGVEDIAHYRY